MKGEFQAEKLLLCNHHSPGIARENNGLWTSYSCMHVITSHKAEQEVISRNPTKARAISTHPPQGGYKTVISLINNILSWIIKTVETNRTEFVELVHVIIILSSYHSFWTRCSHQTVLSHRQNLLY